MTAPVSQSPPPQAEPPPPGFDDPALAVAVAAVITAGPATALAATMSALKARFALPGLAVTALGAVLAMVTEHPPPATGIIGAASAQTSRVNLARRTQFVIAAARRVSAAARAARSAGKPLTGAIGDQLGRERRFYEQHQAAMWNRAAAAGKTDMAAAEHGNLLGWNTVRDTHTSPECRAADGKNYYATSMPDIGFPGAVHPGCRCFPSAPHPAGRLLPGSRPPRYAKAA